MSDVTSQKFRLLALEREYEQKYLQKQAAAQLRENLIGYLSKNSQSDKVVLEKTTKKFSSEAKKLYAESEKFKKLFEQTKRQFSDLIEGSDEKLPDEIERLSEITSESLDRFNAKEDETKREEAASQAIECLLKKCKKQLEKLKNTPQEVILSEILQILSDCGEKTTENLNRLKQELEVLDAEARKNIVDLLDELDMYQKSENKAKQKE